MHSSIQASKTKIESHGMKLLVVWVSGTTKNSGRQQKKIPTFPSENMTSCSLLFMDMICTVRTYIAVQSFMFFTQCMCQSVGLEQKLEGQRRNSFLSIFFSYFQFQKMQADLSKYFKGINKLPPSKKRKISEEEIKQRNADYEKNKRLRTFQNCWLTEFPWQIKEGNVNEVVMKCKPCLLANNTSKDAFVEGSKTMQKSALKNMRMLQITD